MSYFASWQEFSAALHASFVGIFRLGPRSPNSKVAQKKKDWHIAFPLFRYLWTPLFRLATRVNKRVYWARRIKRFFYPQSLWFLDFHNCADGHPYTRCKQRCSTSVMRTCVSIRAISMRNYLPVNTTNFSSLSHFNKTVSSAYLLSFCKVDLAWLWSGSEHVSGAERQNFRSSLSSIYGTPACRSVPVPTHALITLSQRIRSMICVRFTFLRVLCVYH